MQKKSMYFGVLLMAALTLVVFVLMLIASADAQTNEGGPAGEAGGLPAWTERIRIGGTLEGDVTWSARSDTTDVNSDSATELLVSTVELSIGVDFTDWFSGDVLLKAEDIGTDDETGVFVDEAFMTLGSESFPLYMVFGRRGLPFGVFENHLISDPMTQDGYEVARVGITLGVTGPLGLDLSATAYKGEEMMGHFFESGLFDDGAIARVAAPEDNEISSFIVSAALQPVPEALSIYGSFVSEPGTSGRNSSYAVGASLSFLGFRLDGEYIAALERETYAGYATEFKESVVSVTAAYEFVLRKRESIGGALFAERKGHIVSEPLEIAARYEHFFDDGMAEASLAWSVKQRYGAGARYSFYSNPDSGLAAYVAIEYRHTDYRLHASQVGIMAEKNDEAMAKMGVTF